MINCSNEKFVEVSIPKVHYLGYDHTKANANEEDVLKGKTFYAGKSRYIRTGSFDPDIMFNQKLNEERLKLAQILISKGVSVSEEDSLNVLIENVKNLVKTEE